MSQAGLQGRVCECLLDARGMMDNILSGKVVDRLLLPLTSCYELRKVASNAY